MQLVSTCHLQVPPRVQFASLSTRPPAFISRCIEDGYRRELKTLHWRKLCSRSRFWPACLFALSASLVCSLTCCAYRIPSSVSHRQQGVHVLTVRMNWFVQFGCFQAAMNHHHLINLRANLQIDINCKGFFISPIKHRAFRNDMGIPPGSKLPF